MYFDPGTGSLLIQLLVAGIASVGAFFAIFKNKLVSIVKKEKKNYLLFVIHQVMFIMKITK